MRILLVAATEFEIRPLLAKLSQVGVQCEQQNQYQLYNNAIDVLITGVGMVNTACFVGRQLALGKYDIAVNAGIAGAFDKSLPPGTVVNVTEDCIPELGAEDHDNFLSVFELGLTDPNAPPYTNGKLINNTADQGLRGINEVVMALPTVSAITSNTISGNINSISRIRQRSPAGIETMEGAAFFFACLSANMPCLQIRSISNRVEERDKSKWNLDLAIQNLNAFLWEIIAS